MPQNNVYTEPPPKPADIPLRVYSNPICPFAQRVRLIVAALDIPVEYIDVHLKDKPVWYIPKINPHGQVPVVEHEGRLIRESLIGFDYIDDVFSKKSLWPADPYYRAMSKLLVKDFGNKFIPNFYKFTKDAADDSSIATIQEFTKRLEQLVSRHNNRFLGDSKEAPGAVDYIVWPWFERLPVLTQGHPKAAAVFNEEKFPVLYGWINRMKETKAVKATMLPVEAHTAFVKGFKETGQHDYGAADLTGKGVTIYTCKKE